MSRFYSIGHSNRSEEEFIALLKENGIELLVDVRHIPRSRHNPHFNTERLAASLPQHGIAYLHMQDLGGHRKTTVISPNKAWENESFRGYADYTATEQFRTALGELIALGNKQRLAYMCAEAVWWRCHRRLITDQLLARGFEVKHIMGPGQVTDATINPAAVVHPDCTITYPPDQQELEL